MFVNVMRLRRLSRIASQQCCDGGHSGGLKRWEGFAHFDYGDITSEILTLWGYTITTWTIEGYTNTPCRASLDCPIPFTIVCICETIKRDKMLHCKLLEVS